MKRFVSWVLAVAVSLAAASNCRADLPGDFKPLAAVVLSSVDNLANKLGNLALASSNPAMPRAIDSMKMGASAFGIDLAAPCGAFVAADKEGQPIFCAFLPIGNVGAYVAFLKKLPTVDSLELDDGVYAGKIKDGPEFFVQQKGKWVYTANNREVLANVPADPAKLLGDLPKRFDLAVKLFPANVTAEVCQKALDRFQEQFKAAQDAMPEQMVAQAAQRFKEAKLALPGMVAKINEAEDAFAGLLIDPGSNRVRLDVEIKAGNGTSLADRFAMWRPGPSNFGGFLMPEAALSANWTRGMADDEVAAAKNALADARAKLLPILQNADLSDDQMKMVKRWLDVVIGVFEKTADNRRYDGGMAVLLDSAGATVVIGGAVADGAKLESVLREFVAEVKSTDPDTAALIKLNAVKHEGVRFHRVSVPMPSPGLVPYLGETLEIVLGIDDDKLFLAAGTDSTKALKKIISQSKAAAGKEVPPMQMTISAASIAKYVSSHVPMIAMVPGADSTIKSLDGGKDHLVITAKTIYHGIRYRIEIEEGLMKLLSQVPVGPPGAAAGRVKTLGRMIDDTAFPQNAKH